MSSKSKQNRKKKPAPVAQFIPLAVWGDLRSLGLTDGETVEFLTGFKSLQEDWLKRYSEIWKKQHDEMLKDLNPLIEKYKVRKVGGAPIAGAGDKK